MYYTSQEGKKVVIYQDASVGVYARPSLEPLDISLTPLSFEPNPSETA